MVVSACTTQKRKGDVGKLAKFYHNTTAEFNGYFNANELFNESVAQLDQEYQDNYNKILPVFRHVATDNPKSVASNMDAVIEKVSIVATIHRVSDWTDDCYLMLGKAQFIKQDYESAEETLEYLAAEFNPETMKKKGKKRKKVSKKKKKKSSKKKSASKKKKKENAKKRKKANKKLKKKKKKKSSSKKKKSASSKKKDSSKTKKESTKDSKVKPTKKKDAPKKKVKEVEEDSDEKPPKSNMFRRPPAYQEGQLWLARTYIEREDYDNAADIIDELERSPTTLEEVKRELAPVHAHYFLKQKNYEGAVGPLKRAIDRAKKKDNRARYSYILAQIYQKLGQGEESYASYEKASKNSNSYEMRFSAKLNMAKNDYVNGRATAAQITKDLEKMVKDIKNEEYRDQIYFTLADIALKNNNKEDAITYLQRSLNFSSANKAQKAESYALLADLYYENQDFVNAKLYFDSTLQVLPKTDERYDRITKFSNNLTEIAENILIIQEQDSLLRLSKLSDKEKEALAYKIRQQQEEDRINQLKSGANKKNTPDKFNNRRPSNRGGNNVAASTFFAYNERTIKKGKKDFDKRWDKRPLEDNWRRANRRGAGDIVQEEIVEEVPSGVLTEDDIKSLLKDVPSNAAEIKAAEDKIVDAMFKLGSLYRDRLELNDKAVQTLEELNSRFPDNKHELDSWYFLYLAHTDLGNSAKAKEYYDKITGKYPNTTYARVLKDPNFLENSKEEERRLTVYYDETYISFKKGKYQDAAQRAVKASELFGPSNALQARFALLNAMCLGNIQGKDAYEKELREVIAKYPGTPEQKRAREILLLLGVKDISIEDKEKVGGENKKAKGENTFKIEDNKMHYCIVVLSGKNIKLSNAKASVSDYHRQYHKLDKLRVANVYLGVESKTPSLVIRRFKNKEIAMSYFEGIKLNGASYLPEGIEYEVFPITQYNYRQVLKNKEIDSYREFFQENYQ